MSIVAINLALIPKPIDLYHDINRALYSENDRSFLFDGNHIPHITLLQVYVSQDDLLDLWGLVAARVASYNLRRQEGVSFVSKEDGSALLMLEPLEDLKALHQDIHELIAPFVRVPEVPAEAFREPPSDSGIHCVANFREIHSLEKFEPHITLGKGLIPEEFDQQGRAQFPLHLECTKFVLARLGRNGTIPSQAYYSVNV